MATSSKVAEVTALEYSTVKVPYEVLNKKFRQAQKIIDREIAQLNTSINNVSKLPSDLQKPALTSLQSKLMTFRNKYMDCLNKERGYAEKCLNRLDHLTDYVNLEENSVNEIVWKKKRLDKMLVDYFLRKSYYDVAIDLVKESGIEDVIDMDIFVTGRHIESSLRAHDTAPCLQWCHDNKSRLKKTKTSLEFNLHTQNFIEMIRGGNYMQAIEYAQKNLVNNDDDERLQETLVLLAFKPDTDCEKYEKFFSAERWQELILQFRAANFELYHLQSQSLLTTVLQSGLSVMKTHQCYSTAEKSADCPVCNEPLNTLALKLPYSHCTQSKLICKITGKPLNEHNTPMMLPNGYVYGEVALREMMEKDGIITCPRTQEKFWLDQALKVYVM